MKKKFSKLIAPAGVLILFATLFFLNLNTDANGNLNTGATIALASEGEAPADKYATADTTSTTVTLGPYKDQLGRCWSITQTDTDIECGGKGQKDCTERSTTVFGKVKYVECPKTN